MKMWWNGQGLDRPREDKNGQRWLFRVWHDVVARHHVVRVFFWSEDRTVMGVVPSSIDGRTHVRAVRALIEKLVADSALRDRYRQDLRFPVERHYAHYEDLPAIQERSKNA